jgi:hypothetical protein
MHALMRINQGAAAEPPQESTRPHGHGGGYVLRGAGLFPT